MAANDSYKIMIGGGVRPEVFANLSAFCGVVGGVTSSLSGLVLPLTTLFSGAALSNFVMGSARAADALGDLREETGLAIETLGGLKLAADIKDLGSIELPMKRFSAAVREAQVEGTKFNQIFKAMGVDPMQALDKVLFDVADKFNNWEDGINKLGIAEELFGTKQTRFIQLLNEGGDALRGNVAEFKSTHTSVNEAAKAVDDYNAALARMKSSAEGLAQSAVVKVGPFLSGVADTLRMMINPRSAPNFPDTMVGIFGQIAGGKTNSPGGPAPNVDDAKKILSPLEQVKAQREMLDIEIQRSRLMTERGVSETINEQRKFYLVEQGVISESKLLEQKRMLTADMEFGSADQAKLHLQDQQELFQMEQNYRQYLDRKQAMQMRHEEEMARIRQLSLAGTSDMFANMATIAEAFGKKGTAAYRVFATAQAVMDGAAATLAAYRATVGIPYVGPVLAPAAAAAAAAVGAAQIAKINGAFYEGGYTGDMGTSQVAGVVHGREFVMPADVTSRWGVDTFEKIRSGEIQPGQGAGGGANVKIGFVDTRNAMREFMAEEGAKIAYEFGAKKGWKA